METHKHAFNSGIIRKSEYFDLFISYKRDNGGDNGEKLAIELYEKLTKDGFKVWLDNEEIGFSSNFEQRLEEAILHSKKVACIIGPEWVESPHCLFEVRKAIEFEKRIIPIHYQEFRKSLNSKKESGVISENEWIRIDRPQEINFSVKKLYKSSYEDLKSVCLIHDQISLQHNKILSDSYYWNKYKRPKSMLFYGANLSKAKLLRSKCNSDDELPSFSSLQEKFMIASDAFVKGEVTDEKKVFIAYNENDLGYASELNTELKLHGVSTYFETNSPNKNILDSIINCENIIFVGDYFKNNLNQSTSEIKKDKSIFSIARSDLEKQALEDEGQPNVYVWNTELSIDGFISVLNRDESYNLYHSRLLRQAYEWDLVNRNNSKLLGLKDAKSSQSWYQIAEQDNKDPKPSLSMINFVERSLAFAENQRKRKTMGLWTGILGLFFIIILGFLYFQANKQVSIKKNEALRAMSFAKEQKELAKIRTEEAILMEKNASEAEKSVVKFKEKAISAKREANKAAELAQESIRQADDANRKVLEAEVHVTLAISESESAKKQALEALEQAREANELSEQAKTDLATTELEIRAAKAALTSLEYSIDGQYVNAKKWGILSVSLYSELNGEWETDVLYNSFINILNNSDTSIINNTLAKEFMVLHNEQSDEFNLCSYIIDDAFNWELASEIYSDKKMLYAMAVSTSNKNIIALGLKTGYVLIYNRKTKQISDTIKVGPYRITSLAFRSDGKQLAVSSVDNKFFLFTLDNYVNDELANNTIKIQSPRRIEEIYYGSEDVVHAVYAPLVTNGVLEKEYRMFPATVKKLYDIINSK